jgi:hypothetical protein
MNYRDLGDIAALDAIERELGAADSGAVSESVEQAAELEKNGGVAFPYDPVMAQSVTMFMGIGSSVAARKWGEHWQLKEDEAQNLSVATCQLVQHYFPDLEPTNPLMNFCMVAGVVVGPRVMITAMQSGQKQKEQGAADESKD